MTAPTSPASGALPAVQGFERDDLAYLADCLERKHGDSAAHGSTDAAARFIRAALASREASGSTLTEPDTSDAEGNHIGVVAGFARHKYRQGSRECIAFVNGARWWHEVAALASPQVAPAVPEAVYGVSNDDINWPLVWALIDAHISARQHHTPGTSNWGAWLYKALVRAAREATPAQVAPTPTAIRQMAEWFRDHEFDDYPRMKGAWEAIEKLKSLVTEPVALHPDDLAVDRFAAAMKEKLSGARAKGRGGWERPDCTRETLSAMLREHVEKGDPRDVANFCMFLHQRGEGIATPAPVAPTPDPVSPMAAVAQSLRDKATAEREDFERRYAAKVAPTPAAQMEEVGVMDYGTNTNVRWSDGLTQGTLPAGTRLYRAAEVAPTPAQSSEDARDTARLDFLVASKKGRMVEEEEGLFRVYQDEAHQGAKRHFWQAMTSKFYPTIREAIDAAMSATLPSEPEGESAAPALKEQQS